MGGKGTFSTGKTPEYKYKTVRIIDGIKILAPISNKDSNKLPEESHTAGTSYALLDRHGIFHQLRVYNENHEVVLEIGYHKEPGLGVGKILHVHEHTVPGVDGHMSAKKYKLETDNPLFKKYKNLFTGISL